MNLTLERRRMVWMLALSMVAFVVALAGVASYAAWHVRWGLGVFAVAIAMGVAVQVRFIMGAARSSAKV